jgi:hypothetical protein
MKNQLELNKVGKTKDGSLRLRLWSRFEGTDYECFVVPEDLKRIEKIMRKIRKALKAS